MWDFIKIARLDGEINFLTIVLDRLTKKMIDNKLITKEELDTITKVTMEDMQRFQNYKEETAKKEMQKMWDAEKEKKQPDNNEVGIG